MKKIFLLTIILSLGLGLTGCSLVADGNSIGGVFKSEDYGEQWRTENKIIGQDPEKSSLKKIQVSKILVDPFDTSKIYMSSRSNGIWYSEDSAGNWLNILPNVTIYDFALDPSNSGVIYVSLGNKVYKTLDLGKSWEPIYLESREGVLVSAVDVDPVDNLLIYIGTSRGEIYRTRDGGASWDLIKEVNDVVKKIIINPKNSKIIYLATSQKGIYRTSNKGVDWESLVNNYVQNEGFIETDGTQSINIWGQVITKTDGQKNKIKISDLPGGKIYRSLILDPSQADALVLATNFGLVKSDDGGTNWQAIKLLTPANSTIIRALAINPRNNQQIYYTTDTALYRTFDAGKTWLTSSLPSSYAGAYLMVDRSKDNVIYMGMGKFDK